LRFAYRYFPYTRVRRHARTEDASPTLLIGRAADAEVLCVEIESGPSSGLAGWPVVTVERRSRSDDPQYPVLAGSTISGM